MKTIRLTATQLESPSELSPASLVSEHVLDILDALDLNSGATVPGVPLIAMRMYAMWKLHGAVCNGGFFLFFDGHQGEGCRRAIAMFETLGLWEHARIVLLAFERWSPDGPEVDRHCDDLGGGSSFSDLDNTYWGFPEPMDAADAYVRKHAAAFEMCCEVEDTGRH